MNLIKIVLFTVLLFFSVQHLVRYCIQGFSKKEIVIKTSTNETKVYKGQQALAISIASLVTTIGLIIVYLRILIPLLANLN
jgi:hypothetical protein